MILSLWHDWMEIVYWLLVSLSSYVCFSICSFAYLFLVSFIFLFLALSLSFLLFYFFSIQLIQRAWCRAGNVNSILMFFLESVTSLPNNRTFQIWGQLVLLLLLSIWLSWSFLFSVPLLMLRLFIIIVIHFNLSDFHYFRTIISIISIIILPSMLLFLLSRSILIRHKRCIGYVCLVA